MSILNDTYRRSTGCKMEKEYVMAVVSVPTMATFDGSSP